MSRPRVLIGDPDEKLGNPFMEFRLTYEGRLGSGTSASAKHKHDIRRVFHSQLRRLWEINPRLKNMQALWSGKYAAVRRPENERPDRPLMRRDELARAFSRGAYHFVPLVLDEHMATCELEILFLRPGFPGNTLNAGDIDNRIKTLFDALKLPDVTQGEPSEDEEPFFVLLQDDRLITRLSVETDTLLEPTGPDAGEQDARLVVTVRLAHYLGTIWDAVF